MKNLEISTKITKSVQMIPKSVIIIPKTKITINHQSNKKQLQRAYCFKLEKKNEHKWLKKVAGKVKKVY